ncbi:MAG: hypothetical protein DME69_04765 [Verrucomicrobia bacterium]|nr:MAG: hypothetical protein DME69_04765 [Verrucomicrobiota bacterium]
MPATTKKSEQRTFRNRDRVNALFGFVITESLSRRFYQKYLRPSTFSGSFHDGGPCSVSLINSTCEPSTDLSWWRKEMSRLFSFSFEKPRITLTCEAATQVAQTSESAVVQVSKPSWRATSCGLPI